jgi:hypothetical protein
VVFQSVCANELRIEHFDLGEIMEIISVPYDGRFDSIVVATQDVSDFGKQKKPNVLASGEPLDNFVTLAELEEHFQVSRYQLGKLLEKVQAEPCGEVYNYTSEGKRSRGVGKVVYNKSVVDDIEKLTTATVDVAAMKAKALAILQGSSGI